MAVHMAVTIWLKMMWTFMAYLRVFRNWHFMPTQNNANSIIIHNDVGSRNLRCYLFVGKTTTLTLPEKKEEQNPIKPNCTHTHKSSIFDCFLSILSDGFFFAFFLRCRLPIHRNRNAPLRIDLCLKMPDIHGIQPTMSVCFKKCSELIKIYMRIAETFHSSQFTVQISIRKKQNNNQ